MQLILKSDKSSFLDVKQKKLRLTEAKMMVVMMMILQHYGRALGIEQKVGESDSEKIKNR